MPSPLMSDRKLPGVVLPERVRATPDAAEWWDARCGVGIRDATAGFRVFRRTTLESIDLDTVQSAGYVFQTDLAWRTLQAGLTVREVPIEFIERERGDSKMSRSVATAST